jgi:hypothetical protein
MESLTVDAISLKDVDNDGYLDILSGGYQSGNFNLSWIKNKYGTFASTKTTISNNTGATEFSFVDIDNNGYEDLFCVVDEYYDNTLGQTMFYFLNDSSGFGSKMAIGNIQEYANDDRSIFIEDINNDNKPDIITTYNSQQKVHLIVNNSTLSIFDENIEDFNFKIYPVPFTNKLHWIAYNENDSYQIKIFDITGKEVFSNKEFTRNEIDLNFLINGIYIIQFKSSDGREIKRKIIKE